SPTYRWATPFTRLRKENSFRKFVKKIIKKSDIKICTLSKDFTNLDREHDYVYDDTHHNRSHVYNDSR
ncbi:hypothetical protein FHR08_26345, partial [Bacillus cereus]